MTDIIAVGFAFITGVLAVAGAFALVHVFDLYCITHRDDDGVLTHIEFTDALARIHDRLPSPEREG